MRMRTREEMVVSSNKKFFVMTEKIPLEKQNGTYPHDLSVERKSSAGDASTSTAIPNGIARPTAASVLVVCPEMCCYCFEVLIAHLTNSYHSSRSPFLKCFKNDEYPLFVTWKIGREHRLRGCMGTFSAKKLHKGLAEYSITSSTKDSRFPPISTEEISRLECGVSLLTNFERAADYQDWEIGVHGIQIEFRVSSGYKTATYLPEIAREQGWTKVQTIDSLLRKGGYREHITEEYRRTVRVVRYQSEKCVLSYDEYCRYRRRHRPY